MRFAARTPADVGQSKRDVFESGQVREQVVALEHHADVGADAVDVGAQVRDLGPVDQHITFAAHPVFRGRHQGAYRPDTFRGAGINEPRPHILAVSAQRHHRHRCANADIAICDPQMRRTIRHAELHDASDCSPYAGFEVTGWPETVILRGVPVVEGGTMTACATGTEVPRGEA